MVLEMYCRSFGHIFASGKFGDDLKQLVSKTLPEFCSLSKIPSSVNPSDDVEGEDEEVMQSFASKQTASYSYGLQPLEDVNSADPHLLDETEAESTVKDIEETTEIDTNEAVSMETGSSSPELWNSSWDTLNFSPPLKEALAKLKDALLVESR